MKKIEETRNKAKQMIANKMVKDQKMYRSEMVGQDLRQRNEMLTDRK